MGAKAPAGCPVNSGGGYSWWGNRSGTRRPGGGIRLVADRRKLYVEVPYHCRMPQRRVLFRALDSCVFDRFRAANCILHEVPTEIRGGLASSRGPAGYPTVVTLPSTRLRLRPREFHAAEGGR